MSTNQTPRPVPLAPPARILKDWTEVDTAVRAAKDALSGFRPGPQNLDQGMVEEMVISGLAAAGVFTPPPHTASLDLEYCTALYLPHDADFYGPEGPGHLRNLLGRWQQCSEASHHNDDGWHHNGNLSWRDTDPTAMPARTEVGA